MVRIIVLFLILLTVPSANGEDLFSIDVQKVISAALAGAYEANPDLVAGDLVNEHEMSLLYLYCRTGSLPTTASKEDEFYQCRADLGFRIANTTKTTVTREGDRCTTKTESNSISVRVFADGRVSADKYKPYEGKGAHFDYSDCPDTDNTQ